MTCRVCSRPITRVITLGWFALQLCDDHLEQLHRTLEAECGPEPEQEARDDERDEPRR